MATRCFVVLDTESSVCTAARLRVLVSLAYEVMVLGPSGRVRVVHRRYDVVALPDGVRPDAASERVHGLSADACRAEGRPLPLILRDLVSTFDRYVPDAVVGHDIAGDAALIVSEAVRLGLRVAGLRRAFRCLLCTKHLTVGQCCIPLPLHLRYEHPCDALLDRLKGCYEPSPDHCAVPLKWPNLDESYSVLVGDDADAAAPLHDARGDVQRCRLVIGPGRGRGRGLPAAPACDAPGCSGVRPSFFFAKQPCAWVMNKEACRSSSRTFRMWCRRFQAICCSSRVRQTRPAGGARTA